MSKVAPSGSVFSSKPRRGHASRGSARANSVGERSRAPSHARARVSRGLRAGGSGGRLVCRGAVLDTEVSEGIKAALLELIDENVADSRTQINEMLYQLESRNPTLYPTTSPLLNGDWEFKYLPGIAPGPVPSPTREIAMLMYAGGYTPGKFFFDLSKKLPDSALDITGTKVSIQATQPRGKVTATLKVLNNTFPFELRTSIEAESDVRMRETYLDAEAVGRDITIPEQLRTERVFYITYLDDSLLICRDESGTPDVLSRVVTSASVTEEPEPAPEAAEEPAGEAEEPVVEADAAIEPTDEDEGGDAKKEGDDAFNSW